MHYIQETDNFNINLPLYGSYLLYNPNTKETVVKKSPNPKYISVDTFIDVANELKQIATDLKITPAELPLFQYIRYSRYNDATWTIIAGTIDNNFKQKADVSYSMVPNIQQMILPSKETLDFPHFCGNINGLIKGHGDLCGWAGDAVEYAADLMKDQNAVFPSGGFDSEDLRTDLDAYNLYNISNTNIINNIKSYYENITDSKRISLFLKGNENITTRFNNSPDIFYLNILKQKMNVTDEYMTLALNKIQTYMNKNKG